MRILCVAPYFHPKPGGLERYAYEMCRRLAERCEIKVLCSGKEFQVKNYENMEIYTIPVSLKVSNTPISLKLPRIYRRLAEWCDVVYAHTPVPFYYDVSAFLKRKPIVVVYHSGEVSGGGFIGLLAKIYKKLERLLISKADIVIGVSKFVQERKQTDEVVEPGVDLKLFKPTNTTKGDYLLFVGQLSKAHRWKGLNLLIKSLSNTHIRLLVVGEGDMKRYYELLSKKLNVDASFLGIKKDDELIDLYSKAKAVVLPSTSIKESFGMVLLEANACGTAAIGTRVGGIPYYIRDGKNGLLCNPDERSIKNTILSQTDEDLSKMGKVGRKIAEKYNWERAARKTEKIFKNLVY